MTDDHLGQKMRLKIYCEKVPCIVRVGIIIKYCIEYIYFFEPNLFILLVTLPCLYPVRFRSDVFIWLYQPLYIAIKASHFLFCHVRMNEMYCIRQVSVEHLVRLYIHCGHTIPSGPAWLTVKI